MRRRAVSRRSAARSGAVGSQSNLAITVPFPRDHSAMSKNQRLVVAQSQRAPPLGGLAVRPTSEARRAVGHSRAVKARSYFDSMHEVMIVVVHSRSDR